MSYDISVKGDHECTKTTEHQPLIRFLVEVIGFLPDSDNHLRIVDSSGVNYGDVDLCRTSAGRAPQEVNCIQVHLPYAYATQKRATAIDLCRQVASHLGWLIYDEQEGRYIDEEHQ